MLANDGRFRPQLTDVLPNCSRAGVRGIPIREVEKLGLLGVFTTAHVKHVLDHIDLHPAGPCTQRYVAFPQDPHPRCRSPLPDYRPLAVLPPRGHTRPRVASRVVVVRHSPPPRQRSATRRAASPKQRAASPKRRRESPEQPTTPAATDGTPRQLTDKRPHTPKLPAPLYAHQMKP